MDRLVNISVKIARCPECDRECRRHSTYKRTIADRGGSTVTLARSRHYCWACNQFFILPDERFPLKSHYTKAVHDAAVSRWQEIRNLSAVCRDMKAQEGVTLPLSTLHEWVTDWRIQCQSM